MSSIRSTWTIIVLLWNWTVYKGNLLFRIFKNANKTEIEASIYQYSLWIHKYIFFSFINLIIDARYFRLLHTQVAFCCFTDANKSQTEANEIIDKIIKEYGIEKIPMNLLVTYYKVLSMLYFAKSDYNLSYDWSVKALELIGPNTPDKCVKIHNQIQTSVLLQIYKLISHITL